MKRTETELEQQAIASYLRGNSLKQVEQAIGLGSATVYNVLHRYGIPLRTKGGINPIDKNLVAEQYKSGMTMQEIADEQGVTASAIKLYLNEQNIQRRTRNEHYNPNLKHNYFSEIDTERKAYFLGFLITDGCVCRPNPKNNRMYPSIEMQLHHQDSYILQEFLDDVGSSAHIVHNLTRNHDKISFVSSQMAHDLKQYGVVPRKTWETYLPVLKDKSMMPHLVRGLIDGNGWISCYTCKAKWVYNIGFCGNPGLVIGLHAYLVQTLGLKDTGYVVKPNCLHSTKWASQNDMYTLGEWLYKDATIYLTRKREVYEKFKAVRGL